MSIKLQYLGWASFLLTDSQGNTLLTDPFLAGDDFMHVPKSPVDVKDVTVDLIIASHASKDHIEQAPAVLANSEKTRCLGDHVTLIYLGKHGYKGRGELTTAGAIYEMGDFKITAYDARHISFAVFGDGTYLTGEPLVYIIECKNGPTFFFGGDTSITYDMKLWGEVHNIDYALVGIGGVLFPSGRSLDEMNPESAAIACDLLGAKYAIPMHYREREYVERFGKNLQARGNCELIDLLPGQEIVIG